MNLDRATTDDIDALVDCWVSLARDQRRYGSQLRAEANRRVIRESIASHVVADGLLVVRDPEIVGFAMYHVEDGVYSQDVTRGVVSNLFVRPEARNRGVGGTLLSAAEADLVDRGADVVSLEVLARNADARRFYRRQGYRAHRIEMAKPVESDTHSKENT